MKRKTKTGNHTQEHAFHHQTQLEKSNPLIQDFLLHTPNRCFSTPEIPTFIKSFEPHSFIHLFIRRGTEVKKETKSNEKGNIIIIKKKRHTNSLAKSIAAS